MGARVENEKPDLVLHTGGLVAFTKVVVALGWIALAIVGLTAAEKAGSGFLDAVLIVLAPSLGLWGVAALTNLRVSFDAKQITIRRGIWPLKLESIVRYQDIRRVRASDRPVQVTIDVAGRKRFTIANYYTFADRPLPDAEFKEGAFAAPMRRMRSIACFLEERVNQAGPPHGPSRSVAG